MKRGIYRKLAVTNIWNNRKTYLPFLLTSVLTVMMYYMMDAMARNNSIGNENVSRVLIIAIPVMTLFSFVFLFYTNSFLIKRRKKELAVYNILGMGKSHIGRMLAMETGIIWAVSMVFGILGGAVFGKLLHLFLLKILQFDPRIRFRIPPVSLLYTAILFTVIFFLTLIYNLLQVRLSNPAELLRGAEAGEREPKTKKLLCLAGAAAVGTGYYLAVTTEQPVEAISTFMVAAVLVMIGTYCLFTAGSIAVLKLLRGRKKFYYQPTHFTAVSGMLYRMKQNAVGLANICILSTIVLVLVSSTVSLYAGMEDILTRRFPYDFAIDMQGNADPGRIASAEQIIDEGLSRYHVRRTDESSWRYISGTAVRQEKDVFSSSEHTDYTAENAQELYILLQEDYKKIEKDPVQLQPGQVILYTTQKEGYGLPSVTVNGRKLQVVRELKHLKLDESGTEPVVTGWYLILPDEQSVQELNLPGNGFRYTSSFNMTGNDKDCKKAVSYIAERMGAEMPDVICENRDLSREDFFSLYGSLFFIGLYLGSMFLIATVLIIYYKQISEGYDDRRRFEILQKVGMGRREIRRSIRSQILLVFFLPLAAAVVHIAVAFRVISKLLAMLGLTNTRLFLECTVAVVFAFAVFYTFIYAVTAREYDKIVNPREGVIE